MSASASRIAAANAWLEDLIAPESAQAGHTFVVIVVSDDNSLAFFLSN
jgi:hypothetical protein